MRQLRALNTALWIVAGVLMLAFVWVAYLMMQAGTRTWFDLAGPMLALVGAAVVGVVGRAQVNRSDPEKRNQLIVWWVVPTVLIGAAGIALALWLVFA